MKMLPLILLTLFMISLVSSMTYVKQDKLIYYPETYQMKYKIVIQDNEQSLYQVTFNPLINLTDGITYYSICHQIDSLTKSYKGIYTVPSKMPIYDSKSVKSEIIPKYYTDEVKVVTDELGEKYNYLEEKEILLKDYKTGDKIKFCTKYYNPYIDTYLKIGDNSTIIVSSNISNGNTTFIIWNMSAEPQVQNIKHNWNGTNYTFYDSSLVLMYNFDNRSLLGENDTRVTDLSKSSLNATVYGGALTPWISNGKYNGAFNFSGKTSSNSYIATSSSPIRNTNTSFTISSWTNSYGKSSQSIAGVVIFSKADSYGPLFALMTTNYGISTNGYYCAITPASGTAVTIVSSSNYNYNTWNHLSCVIIANASCITNMSLYINGVLDKVNNTLSICDMYDGTPDNIKIGAQRVASNRFFNGSIDDVMIFNRSLSASEISQLYLSQRTQYDSQNWSYQINETNLSGVSYSYFACITNVTGTEVCSNDVIASDIYPTFSNYIDNSPITGSGIGYFNVTVLNSNGTVYLEINNTNITMTNLSAYIFNATYNFTLNKTYPYKYNSWGNGTSHLFNKSDTRNFIVNEYIPPVVIEPSIISFIYPSVQLKVPYIKLGQHLKFT